MHQNSLDYRCGMFRTEFTTQVAAAVCIGIFCGIISEEWKSDEKVYVATILGFLIVILAFIFMVTNAASKNSYEKYHLAIVRMKSGSK